MSWYWSCSSFNWDFLVKDSISLFLFFSHPRRKKLILITEVMGDSIISLISSTWMQLRCSFHSLDLKCSLSTCSMNILSGRALSIWSMTGNPNKLKRVPDANHFFLYTLFLSWIMDSTISQKFSQDYKEKLILLIFILHSTATFSGLSSMIFC